MDRTEPLTVWILGAGFSQALGAPLFRDLFRENNRIFAGFNHSPPPEMSEVLSQYRQHAPPQFGSSGVPSGMLWNDPEEFLDVVESAHRKAEWATELLKSIGDPKLSIDTLVDMGRRALAIECSHFLRGANLQTERWLPYLIWSRGLTKNDTVVTFNYDRVPDILSTDKESSLSVLVPDRDLENMRESVGRSFCAPVLKLHGSVDWKALSANGNIAVVPIEDNFAATCSHGRDIALAVPGPGKVGLREEYRGVGLLWKLAAEAINKASRIVFVGYRFPQTDATARVEILNAIKYAQAANTLRSIEIVLGPDLRHQDVVRMKALLGFVASGIVKVLPLWAQDFLAMPKEWIDAIPSESSVNPSASVKVEGRRV